MGREKISEGARQAGQGATAPRGRERLMDFGDRIGRGLGRVVASCLSGWGGTILYGCSYTRSPELSFTLSHQFCMCVNPVSYVLGQGRVMEERSMWGG